jgi:transposase
VHSASIEVPRGQRRAKTDRLDAEKLLTMLIRYHSGETKVWKVVRPPSLQEEDQRQLHRELRTLKSERTRHSNRLQALLISQGVRLKVGRDFLAALETVRLWDGQPLPPELRARLEREYECLCFGQRQIRQLEAQRRRMIRRTASREMGQVRQLLQLRGLGENTAWLYVMEFFGWRQLRNRRQVGALAGLVPTPAKSGESDGERGISKAGNRQVRAVAIELAWMWLRHQPESDLSRWFERRYSVAGKRARKVGIVALARRLLIALWRYLETGVLPEGARLKE